MIGSVFHWTEWGNANAEPLLFLHGFLGCSADWAEVARTLGNDYRCIAVDLPGHGRTPPNDATFPACLEGLLAALDQAGVGPCPWIGYSMGGRIALYGAARRPDRVNALILESASPGLEDKLARRERRESDEMLACTIERTSFSSFLAQWYDQPMFAPLRTKPERFDAMLERRRKNQPAWVAEALRGLGAGVQPSLWPEWKRLDTPATLIAGALDEKFTAIAEAMAARRPGTEVIVAPECGHNVHAEAPAAYTRALRTALSGGNPGGGAATNSQ